MEKHEDQELLDQGAGADDCFEPEEDFPDPDDYWCDISGMYEGFVDDDEYDELYGDEEE